MQISILEFQPSNSKLMIDSPRSLQAIQNLGFVLQDLTYPTEQQIRNQPIKPEFKEDEEFFYSIKMSHLKDRCNQYIEQVKIERERIITKIERSSAHIINSSLNQLFFDRVAEKQELMIKTLRNKQQIEIENSIENELQSEMIKKKKNDKQLKIEELRLKRELQKQQQDLKKQEKLRQRDEKLLLAKNQIQTENEKILQKQQENDEKLRIQEKKRNEKKLKMKEENDRIRNEKMDHLQIRLKEQQSKIEEDNQIRQDIYHEKLTRMQETMRLKQQFLQTKNKLLEENIKQKVSQVTQNNQQYLQMKEQKFKEQEMNATLRKSLLQLKQQNQLERKQEEERRKQQSINEKRDFLESQMEERNRSLLESKEKKNFSRERKPQEIVVLQKEHKKLDIQIQKQLIQKKFLKQNGEANQNFAESSQFQSVNSEKIFSLMVEQKRKHILDFLKLEDIGFNHARLRRLEDLRSQKLTEVQLFLLQLQRMEQNDQRQQQFQRQQQQQLLKKQQMEQQLESEKQSILADFSRKKKEYIEQRIQQTSLNQSQNVSMVPYSTHRTMRANVSQPFLTTTQRSPWKETSRKVERQHAVQQPSVNHYQLEMEQIQSEMAKFGSQQQKSASSQPKRIQAPIFNKSWLVNRPTFEAVSLYLADTNERNKVIMEIKPIKKKKQK